MIKVIVEETMVALLERANSLKLNREDIINIVKSDSAFYLFYYKK